MAQQQEGEYAKQKSIDQRIADERANLDSQKNQEIYHKKVRESVQDCLEATKGIYLHGDLIPRDRNGAVHFPQLDMDPPKTRRSNSR